MQIIEKLCTQWHSLLFLTVRGHLSCSLVKNPKTESYQKLLDAVEERASLQDGA